MACEYLRFFSCDSAWKLLTFVITVFGGYIAWRQYHLGREKLKFDLFEKRFAVFSGARKFLSTILIDGSVDLKHLFEFRTSTVEAAFLFGDEIVSYLAELDSKALKMRTLHVSLEDIPAGDKRTRMVEDESELLEWLTNQLPLLKERFGPYLRLKA